MIKKILELSTCHVEQSDMEKLKNETGFSVGNYEYGAFFFISENVGNAEYSESFRKVLVLAAKEECIFVCLDCDALIVGSEDLNHNEW